MHVAPLKFPALLKLQPKGAIQIYYYYYYYYYYYKDTHIIDRNQPSSRFHRCHIFHEIWTGKMHCSNHSVTFSWDSAITWNNTAVRILQMQCPSAKNNLL